MGIVINLLLWPLGALALYLGLPLLFPDDPPPPFWLIALIALAGMASCIWGLVVRQTLNQRNPTRPPLSAPDD